VGNSVTHLVIDAKQGIKSLKVQNRKVNFFPADWIAGVDYEPNNNENDKYIDAEYEENEA
jgi:hypothetical protein